ncbi:MAG: thioredoxin domain-containing protein [Elainellaceae cyanobacterium]
MSIPVPPRPSGYRLGSGDAPIHVEVFIDLECPFSKKAWSTISALADLSGDRLQPMVAGRLLTITALPTVLCDHRQSWDLTKTLAKVAGADAPRGWQFISHLYQHHQAFSGDAFTSKTRQDLFDLIEQLVTEFDPNLPAADLVRDISSDDGEIADQAKASIRYAISRGVWSTPTFVVNGSEVPKLESSATVSDWRDFLVLV